MSGFVIAIVVVSTFMHAGWNLLARYSGSEGDFYRRMLVISLIVGFLPAVISELQTGSMTRLAWICVIASGTCAAFYLFGLARAFHLSDFTIVYPVARALPVLFIALIDVQRGRVLSPLGWAGILLVVIGSVLIPQQRFGDFRLRNYWNIAVVWMIVAALGTIGYTVLDKFAAEVIQSGPASAAALRLLLFCDLLLPLRAPDAHGQREKGNGAISSLAPGWFRCAAGIRCILVDPLGLPVEPVCQLYCRLQTVKHCHRGDPGICAV